MLFYEFFKKHMDQTIRITLKNGLVLSGNLRSIDPFLNMRIDCVEADCKVHALEGMSVCSIRGSAIKCVDLERNPSLDKRLSEATLLKFSLDK